MNNKVDISLIVALRSGVQLALKNVQRLLIVIGIVTLSIIAASVLSALLVFLVAQISTERTVLMATYIILFVLANVMVHGFLLWYFKEILRIVRGHTRSFPELKEGFTRGWQLFATQMLFISVLYVAILIVSVLMGPAVNSLAVLSNSFLPSTVNFVLSNIVPVLVIALLFAPALYWAARLCLYPFFFADGKGIVESLRASFTATRKHMLPLIVIGAARMSVVGRIIAPQFAIYTPTIPALVKIGLASIMLLFLGAIFDLAAAHIYQRLTHPDQAVVPPGVTPLD